MKTLYTLAILLLFTNSYAQNFIPILEEDNIWTIGGDIGFGFQTSPFSIQGEEVIDGKTYKKLYRSGVELSCRFREENGILYGYVPNQSVEKILMDFNMVVDDTIDVIPQQDLCIGGIFIFDYYKVMEVSTQFIAGADRKVLQVNGFDSSGNISYEELWIEGIGSTSGIVPGGYDFDNTRELTCFEKNGEITFFNDHTRCEYIIGYEDYYKDLVTLSPNPVSAQALLTIPLELGVDLIEIFDLQGRIIHTEAVTSDHYILEAEALTTGMYFYRISSASELIKTSRFIVE